MSYNELIQRGTVDFPIELYTINEFDPRYEMVSHWHSEVEIIRVTKGVLNIRLNNNTYTAKKDDILFINPEIIHSATPKDCVYECIVFDAAYLSAAFKGGRYFFDGIVNSEYTINEYIPFSDSEVHKSAEPIF